MTDEVDAACVARLEDRLLRHDSTKYVRESKTTEDQNKVQRNTAAHFQNYLDAVEIVPAAVLEKKKIVKYCTEGLRNMSQGYESLDASRPWLIYWNLHSLDLIDYELDDQQKHEICEFLELCQSPSGGFGGGPGQIPHLAPSYAAMNVIAILGCNNFQRAYAVVNRDKMADFIRSMWNPANGSFQMHEDGEADTRAVYCAASIATMLRLDMSDIFDKSIEYVISCQSWDGGFSPIPGGESHGGFTYTSLAALTMFGGIGKIRDKDSLIRWLVNRQMSVEGGFNGRANKLVDSCYNFWQGGSFPLVHSLLKPQFRPKTSWICDTAALQDYTLFAAQYRRNNLFIGGFSDRPGNSRDHYHTCYSLSGLSIMQHFYDTTGTMSHTVVGERQNEIAMTNPLHNVRPAAVLEIYDFFEFVKAQKGN